MINLPRKGPQNGEQAEITDGAERYKAVRIVITLRATRILHDLRPRCSGEASTLGTTS
jgi:hypothetical protein